MRTGTEMKTDKVHHGWTDLHNKHRMWCWDLLWWHWNFGVTPLTSTDRHRTTPRVSLITYPSRSEGPRVLSKYTDNTDSIMWQVMDYRAERTDRAVDEYSGDVGRLRTTTDRCGTHGTDIYLVYQEEQTNRRSDGERLTPRPVVYREDYGTRDVLGCLSDCHGDSCG